MFTQLLANSATARQDNLGNNATFGLVVTEEGVVLIDSGGTHAGAREIDLTN